MKSALFLFYVFIEVMITVPLASAIGVLYTFLEIVLSAFLGFAILFNTPFTIKENLGNIMQNRLLAGVLPLAVTIRIFAAFLLILPGFFGDTTGLVLLAWSAILLISGKVSNSKHKKNDENVIDVEIIEDSK